MTIVLFTKNPTASVDCPIRRNLSPSSNDGSALRQHQSFQRFRAVIVGFDILLDLPARSLAIVTSTWTTSHWGEGG